MNETEQILLDSSSRMIDQYFPEDALLHAQPGAALTAWSAIEELGLNLALVPEEAGGFGLESPAALATLQLAGARALPAPLGETMAANALLAAAALPVADGPAAIAQAPATGPPWLERVGAGWHLEAQLERVAWGADAQAVLVEAQGESEPVLVRLSPSQWSVERRGTNLAGHPRDTLLIKARIAPSAVASLPGGTGALLRVGAAIRTLLMAGAAQSVLDLTAAYVSEREQFGRSLSKFQAIQQEVAKLAGHVAAIKGAAGICAEYLEGAPTASLDLAGARARACEAAGPIAAIAHQVHGAIGFSQEYRLHLHTKLLWSWRDEFMGESFWSGVAGDEIIGRGADDLWRLITRSA